ncbi:hypothetical protein IF1G_06527 [Cordyceps javanica]|uniref:Uncharacterized protein n=1 Tax=Cordyceps javanica TaxID=43265 RepID=A0A545UYI8_9HYPO|nr:hypothetical protein IF1G_06527 [Cordyceps javanica]TQW06389.1 hypothetical protein IF2G_05811 [Cordyceps javanica]
MGCCPASPRRICRMPRVVTSLRLLAPFCKRLQPSRVATSVPLATIESFFSPLAEDVDADLSGKCLLPGAEGAGEFPRQDGYQYTISFSAKFLLRSLAESRPIAASRSIMNRGPQLRLTSLAETTDRSLDSEAGPPGYRNRAGGDIEVTAPVERTRPAGSETFQL